MHICLIWAMGENRVIGRDNGLPWRLPKDMRYFMQTTMGKPVLMGRKTFESMKAALPGRTNIVLTRDPDWRREGVIVVHDLQSGIDKAREQCRRDGQDELMVIGGADVYAAALPVADRLYVTHVHAQPEGDVFFPSFDLDAWRMVECERVPADANNAVDFTIARYERGAA